MHDNSWRIVNLISEWSIYIIMLDNGGPLSENGWEPLA